MLSRFPVALFAMVATSALWLIALGELSNQPVTHTGTQPHHRVTP